MESKLFKIFASLGVPGLALGVFYMLFRAFDWKFPIVPSTWVGPIIVLFMLLTSAVVFYTLTLWRPQRGPNVSSAMGNPAARIGAVALQEVLERLHVFLERESNKLNAQDSEVHSLTSQLERVDAAMTAVERAANHTRHYQAKLRVGQRDRNTERTLSDEWLEVRNCLRNIDIREAGELYQICFNKARYWSDTDGWDDSYTGCKDISLENVLNIVHEITK